MNLKSKFVSIAAVAALSLSMGAGIASAQMTDSEDTLLNVTCPHTSSVGVTVDGQFSVDASVGASSYDASGVEFGIKVDLTCNWSDDFRVRATIGNFNFVGTAPSGSAQSFGGSHLLLTGGSGVYSGPETLIPWAGAPMIEPIVFEGFEVSDPDVIESDSFLFFDKASPGVTEATWDGQLNLLPPNLAGGVYKAPLTVTLTVN